MRPSIPELYQQLVTSDAAAPRELSDLPHRPERPGGTRPIRLPQPSATHVAGKTGEVERAVQPASFESLPDNEPLEAELIPWIPAEASGPPVSDTFVETDVRQAILSLATQAQVSVIMDEQVAGLTNAIIADEPFEAALRRIILPLGYVSRKVDGQYLVGPPDPESALFPMIAERFDYETRHRSTADLISLLPPRYRNFVRTGDNRTMIIVEAPAEIAHRILQDLRRSDLQAPQVVLEAIVCVYSPESSIRFGFDIEHGVQLKGGDALKLGMSSLGMSGHLGAQSLSGLNDFAFTATFLRALEQEGYVSIRAAPRVMAQNGQKAQISIGRETFFSVQPQSSNLLFRQDIQKVESGITLDITPIVRGSNVTVQIERAEVSEDIRTVETKSDATDRFPIINRRRVTTTVEVPDGKTIVIGGLMQRQEVDHLNKVPYLSAIPLIGRLFQRIDRQEQEAEVAIFISPRIVQGDEL